MTKPTRKDLEEWGACLARYAPKGLTLEDIQASKDDERGTRFKLRPFLVSPLFRPLTASQIGPTTSRPTVECFRSKRWLEKEHGLGNWLPQMQPATPSCSVTILETTREATFKEMAAVILDLDPEKTSEHRLEQGLLAKQHVLTLPQAEVLVKRADTWTSKELALGDPGNFVLTENGVEGISVVSIRCEKQHWEPLLKAFSSDHEWRPGSRLIVANFDASRLDHPSRS
jgi:hypothetical protein